MRILLITIGLPYPPTSGGKLRAWHLLQQIGQRHEVTLLSLLDSAGDVQFLPHLQEYCAHVETVVKRRRRSRGKLFLRLMKTVLKGQPPRNGISYYEAMESKIQEVAGSQSFDIIQIEQSAMAPYIECMDNTNGAAHLISLYDVGMAQIGRISKVQSSLQDRFWARLDWFFLRHWEPAYLARHFDKCVVVSPSDEALLRRANPSLDMVVVPNGVDTVHYGLLPEIDDSKDILFIGNMRYAPNIDGAIFFRQQVFPLIKRQIPDARLWIVGANPVPAVQSLASDDVIVTGRVQSVVPYYQQSVVSVVPIRAGSGTRLKILESMALGRPVVSTTLGCEGLAVTQGENILIGDSPADFANQVVRLINSRESRQRIIASGRHLVESMYDWQCIGAQLLQVYDEVRRR